MTNTQKGLAANQLLTLIPQLQRIEVELDDSVREDERKAAGRLLVTWRGMAAEIQGLLGGHNTQRDDVELADAMQQSMLKASLAKANLLDGRFTCRGATQDAREAIAIACEHANVFAGQLKTYSAGENHA